jgi:hypothetical protein
MTASCVPDMTACAANWTACCEEPHCRSMVTAGTVCGSLEARTALRPTCMLCSPTCRDVDESRECGLPIYGKVGVPITARSRILEIDWNVLVDIAGAPGDLVLADASGVVFVPIARAEEVLAAAEQIAAKERLMAAEVDRGRSMAEVMGANYEAMLSKG